MKGKQLGFTLLELMVVVVVIGILAAMALPSYQRYIVRNAEMEAQSQMGMLQSELERWRTSAMSYRGFFPSNGVDSSGKPKYEYNDSDNTKIYVPIGSTASNYRYEITLLDGSDNSTGLSESPTTTFTAGRSWVMLAVPNPSHATLGNNKARAFLQRSTGFKCATTQGTPNSTLSISENDCAISGLEKW